MLHDTRKLLDFKHNNKYQLFCYSILSEINNQVINLFWMLRKDVFHLKQMKDLMKIKMQIDIKISKILWMIQTQSEIERGRNTIESQEVPGIIQVLQGEEIFEDISLPIGQNQSENPQSGEKKIISMTQRPSIARTAKIGKTKPPKNKINTSSVTTSKNKSSRIDARNWSYENKIKQRSINSQQFIKKPVIHNQLISPSVYARAKQSVENNIYRQRIEGPESYRFRDTLISKISNTSKKNI